MAKTALWRAVKKAQPDLTDQEVTDLLTRTSHMERDLVLKGKLNLDQARELVREELFPAPMEDEEPTPL